MAKSKVLRVQLSKTSLIKAFQLLNYDILQAQAFNPNTQKVEADSRRISVSWRPIRFRAFQDQLQSKTETLYQKLKKKPNQKTLKHVFSIYNFYKKYSRLTQIKFWRFNYIVSISINILFQLKAVEIVLIIIKQRQKQIPSYFSEF